MVSIIQISFITISGLILGYLALLSCLAVAERKKVITAANKLRRFVVVIPAYNEEDEIAKTVRNLFKANYPRKLFDVIVIADNCTDQTAEFARNEGALVWERINPNKRGKGYALRWAFDRISSEKEHNKYDSIIVLDADTIVLDNFFKVFNAYRDTGAEVIQGYLSVRSKSGAWASEIIRIGFTLYNFVRPLGRRKLGFSPGLRGNGMCFSLATLEQVPWDAYSLTEDLEYGLKLLLHEVDIVFAHELICYSIMPENPKNAESQRERWEMGRYPVVSRYLPKMVKFGLLKRSPKIFDAVLDLVTPPVVNLILFVLIMMGLSILLWWQGIIATLIYVWLWAGMLGLGMVHAFVGLYAADADGRMYRSLLYVPKYALWKLYLYGKVMLKGRAKEWVRTARE